MRKLYAVILAFVVFACQPAKNKVDQQGHTPEWAKNAVTYEVNIRQYTPEGTFKAFETHLPRLKELGVDILWLMPITPISEKNRKGSLGSYYSVKDYKAVNPEFGTMDDFKNLVNKAHEMGFRVIIDWVANHTGWDNAWITEHQEWYTHDSTGAIIPPNPDWRDVADLNFESQPMRRAMIDAMRFWVKETNIDGFRCDVAWGVPQDFWEAATASLDSLKPVFMLAEDEDHPGFLQKAFESDYAWKFHHLINDVAKGKKNAADVAAYFSGEGDRYAPGSFPMQFITNHDENSNAGSEFERMGDAVHAFVALTFTVEGMPLIYSGQEAGLKKRLRFFEKDTINWSDLSMQRFYESLVKLKHANQALWNGTYGGPMNLLEVSNPTQVFAFSREKNGNEVIAVFNLSAALCQTSVKMENPGDYTNYFSGEKISLGPDVTLSLAPWSCKIFIRG